MKDDDWIILDALSRNPNISSLARFLYMSQPTLTKRIQHIETEFGIQIAERTPQGLKLTKEGTYLCKRAERYISFAEKTRRELEAMKRSDNHVITIGSSYTFNRYNLWDILSDYNKTDPSACFDVANDLSQNLFRLLLDDKVDVAFVRGDYEGPVEKIHVERAQGYIVSANPVELDDLPKMRRIEYRTSPHTAKLAADWWKERFDTKLPFGMLVGYLSLCWKPIATSEDMYTICFLTDKFENSFNLHLTPIYYADGTPVTRDSWCMYQKSKVLPEHVKSFIDYVASEVALSIE